MATRPGDSIVVQQCSTTRQRTITVDRKACGGLPHHQYGKQHLRSRDHRTQSHPLCAWPIHYASCAKRQRFRGPTANKTCPMLRIVLDKKGLGGGNCSANFRQRVIRLESVNV
jgi:hypothetical protein